jgi:GntR family transcriptional regulator/MocR family aminotransferase
MQDAIIYLDFDSDIELQSQIRQKLVEGILNGVFPPGCKLPSSRKLAEQLGVARNTVVLAYQQLVAESYLVSRERSGIFVNRDMLDGRLGFDARSGTARREEAALWRKRVKSPITGNTVIRDIPDWKKYPFPFIDGKFDTTLFPLTEWREANRLALSVADVNEWSTGSGDADDHVLVEEIRTKILPRRGIQANSDEILITMGTQNGLSLVTELLVDKTVSVAIEEPGNSAMRQLLQKRQAKLFLQRVDEEGIVVNAGLNACDLVYVAPSHQIPTAVAMSTARRRQLLKAAVDHDFVIVEDDYECETNYENRPLPALRSMDKDNRVIYLASLSKVFAPGIRLGFIAASPEFIERARELRRMMLNHPPLNIQRTVAYFLSLGHYDSLMLRLGKIFRERRRELREALNNTRGVPIEISPVVGGTTYWVRSPEDFDVDHLVQEAMRNGILIEPVRHYYADAGNAENCFRMGVTSLAAEKIRPGVTKLVEVIRDIVKGHVEHLETSSGDWLTGDDLQQAMSGATVLVPEVYRDPCTIELHADGSMSGRIGYANEDRDTGCWRVDGDRFYRRWNRWNYAEERGYYIVIDGDTIKYFNDDRQVVDSGLIRLGGNTD